jgi:hypothetical protein
VQVGEWTVRVLAVRRRRVARLLLARGNEEQGGDT